VVDGGARLGGRGAWVHPTSQCVSRALTRKAFARALRVDGPVDVGAVARWLARQADQADDNNRSNPGKRVQPSMDTQ